MSDKTTGYRGASDKTADHNICQGSTISAYLIRQHNISVSDKTAGYRVASDKTAEYHRASHKTAEYHNISVSEKTAEYHRASAHATVWVQTEYRLMCQHNRSSVIEHIQ